MDAKKQRFGAEDVLALLKGVRTLVVAKGKKVTRVDLAAATERPNDADLIALLLGPTGNLRAPTMRIGTTMLVGFNAEAYEEVMTP